MVPKRRAPALPALSFLLPAAFFLLFLASTGHAQQTSNVQMVHTDLPKTEIPFEPLFQQPNMDPVRLGIWGGATVDSCTEMVMFTRPGVFSVGVAIGRYPA